MLKKLGRRTLSLLLVFLLVVSVFAVIPSSAATLTSVKLSINGRQLEFKGTIKPTKNNGTISAGSDGKSLDFNVKSTSASSQGKLEFEVAIPGNYILSFDFVADISGSLARGDIQFASNSVDDVTIYPENGYHYNCAVSSGGTPIYFAFYSNAGTENKMTASLKNLTLMPAANYNVTVNGAQGGSVTVNGSQTLTDGDDYSATVSNALGMTMVAVPDNGYVFAGYSLNDGDQLVASRNADNQYTYYPFSEGNSIAPVFVPVNQEAYLVGGEAMGYYLLDDFNDALDTATFEECPMIIPITDVVIGAGEYEVPSGTTLLIPNDDQRTLYTLKPNVAVANSARGSYVRMTLESGANLTVADGAAVSLAGNIYAPSGGQSSSVTGKYGQLVVSENANVTFESGSNFYAWGFATGDGVIECLEGAKAYEMFQINDFSGGSISLALFQDGRAFPFSQYYVQNVECKLKMWAGSEESVYGAVHAGGGIPGTGLVFIGSDGAMFTVNSGYVLKYYDFEADKLVCRVEGDAEINSIQVEFAGVQISSADFQLPISNIGVEVGSGSNVVINQDLQLSPDSYVVVEDGAYLDVESHIFLVDQSDWVGQNRVYRNANLRPLVFSATRYDKTGSGASPRTANGSVDSAQLDNNGEIEINGGGSLNTTPGGAVIISSEGTGTIINNSNEPGAECVLIDFTKIKSTNVDGTVIIELGDAVIEEEPITLCADIEEGETYEYSYDSVRDRWYRSPVTVKFVIDDEIVKIYEDVDYGTAISAPDATKPSTPTVKYTFVGWRSSVDDRLYQPDELTEALDGVTFTAEYTEEAPSFTVIWKNYDGTVLETDEGVSYGDTPSYDGDDPVKPADGDQTYTFSGWTPEIAPVTGDITYTATFSADSAGFTVTWVNYDGTELEVDTGVAEGSNPSYDGQIPTKPADVQYTYTFDKWTPELSAVSGDITYTATFSATVNKYTVQFENYDGTVLQSSEVAYGDIPVYTGANPTKPSTARYSYSFDKWSPDIAAVTGEATYTATFKATTRKYTVKFVNYDGTVLQNTKVAYGSTPAYNGAAPTRPADAQYTYTFDKWTPEITAVTGTATYTASFKSTVNKYTIKFVNYDDTVLQSSEVAYGEIPVYNGDDPEKPTTAEHTYTFAGWDPQIAAVEGEATYKAIFTSETNSYTVIWKNYDGTVLETDENVLFGTVPTYDGADPVKPADLQNTYTFAGWNPDVVGVAGDAAYTAQFDAEQAGSYTITLTNAVGWDTVNVHYWAGGQTGDVQMTDTGSDNFILTAVIPSTVEGIVFNNGTDWTADVTDGIVDGARWVICNYNNALTVRPVPTYYLVGSMNSWTSAGAPEFAPSKTDSGIEEYQLTVDLNANDAIKVYGDNNTWYPDGLGENYIINADGTYTIYFRPNYDGNSDWYESVLYVNNITEYTVTWVDGNGETLKTETLVYGSTPAYTGDTPTKTADAHYTYTFNNTWSPEIVPVTADATYTAQFDTAVNKYTIKFVNYDGTELQSSEYEYGATPVFSGTDPTKPSDAEHTYTFIGWDPEIKAVDGNATYTAQFSTDAALYTVRFVNFDGTELQSSEYEYGATPVFSGTDPTRPADAQYTYNFTGWDPEIKAVTGNATYTAQYSTTTNKYTIKFVNYDGTELQSSEVEYGTTPVFSGTDPTKPSDTEHTYTFIGWDPEIKAVDGNATYTAQFSTDAALYTVRFVNYDGNELQSSEVAYGATPVFSGTDPTRPADVQYTYNFIGWDPEIKAVDGNATYIAQFSTDAALYTIRFVNDDGTELQSSEVAYGATPVFSGADPTKAATAQYTYFFSGWDPEIKAVTGDATYTATYTSTVNKYTIRFLNYDGTELSSGEVEFGTVPVYAGADPAKQADESFTYEFAGWDPEIKAVDGSADYTAVFTPVPIVHVEYFTSHSLSLNGTIATNFYINLPEDEDPADFSVMFIVRGVSYTTADLGTADENVTWSENGRTALRKTADSYIATITVNAPEMTDTIQAILYKGETAVDTDEYKAAEYGTDHFGLNKTLTPGNYYLVGKIKGTACWQDNIQAKYELTLNAAQTDVAEYMITDVDFNAGDEFKIVLYNGEGSVEWFPDNSGNYVVDADGTYTVYFRPGYNGYDDWFCRAFTAIAQESSVNELVRATLNYGAKVQRQFNENVDDMADTVNTYIDVEVDYPEVTQDMVNAKLGDAETASIPVNVFGSYGLELYGSSLVTNANTKIKLYFAIKDAETFEQYKDTFFFNGEVVEAKRVSSDVVCFELSDIASVDLDTRYTLTNSQGDASVSYAALDYVTIVLATQPAGSTLYELAQALYWYNVYADAYFG